MFYLLVLLKKLVMFFQLIWLSKSRILLSLFIFFFFSLLPFIRRSLILFVFISAVQLRKRVYREDIKPLKRGKVWRKWGFPAVFCCCWSWTNGDLFFFRGLLSASCQQCKSNDGKETLSLLGDYLSRCIAWFVLIPMF